MALDFPTGPGLNQVYTEGNRSWQWNGRYWQAVSVTVGYSGSIGYTGSKGGSDIRFIDQSTTLTNNLQEIRLIGTGFVTTVTNNAVTINFSGGGGGGGSPNLDGGLPDSFYGGIAPFDAGGVT